MFYKKKEQHNITNVSWVRNKRGRTRLGTSKEEQKYNRITITGNELARDKKQYRN